MQLRRKPSIAQSIVYGFGALILLYAGHGIYSFQALQRLAHLTRTIHDHPLVVSNAALRASKAVAGIHCDVREKAQDFLEDGQRIGRQLSHWSIFFFVTWILLAVMIAWSTVSGSRKNEVALAGEKEKLMVTLRSIGDGVITTDRHGRLTMMNPVAEQLTGWTEAEAFGQPIGSVLRLIDENTRESCDSPVEAVLAAGHVVGLADHAVLIARDGTERAIADSGAPIQGQDDRIIGAVLVFRDQSEERRYRHQIIESERKYRLLSESTVDVIWTMDFEAVIRRSQVGPLYRPTEDGRRQSGPAPRIHPGYHRAQTG